MAAVAVVEGADIVEATVVMTGASAVLATAATTAARGLPVDGIL
jgi:hypothetical protein